MAIVHDDSSWQGDQLNVGPHQLHSILRLHQLVEDQISKPSHGRFVTV